jgi:hypothetical protein
MQNQRIFIKALTIGPRLRYVVDEIFKRRLGLEVVLGDQNAMPETSDFLVSYGLESRGWIIPESGVLNSGNRDGIRFQFENLDFHRVADQHGNRFSVDWLGLIFWYLSRLEEYQLKNRKDSHGRFAPFFSPLFALGKFEFPWVDFWVERIRKQLEEADFVFPSPKTEIELSFDLDNLLAYKEKGWKRNAGGFFRDFIFLRWKALAERSLTLLDLKKDPFETIAEMEAQIKPGHNPMFFVWIGDQGPFDKGLSFNTEYFAKTIRLLSEKYRVGLHPSYASFSQPQKLKSEKERLKKITRQKVVFNRFHFLRFRLPESYRLLIANGFEHDFSMGFSEIMGYRAGTGHSFYWYDVEQEETTKLLIHPFCMMDSTARFQLKWDADKFIAQFQKMKGDAISSHGKMHILLHNEFISWNKGWENLIEKIG